MNVSVAVVPNSVLDNHVGTANDTRESSDWLDREGLSLDSVSDCGAEFTSPDVFAFDFTIDVVWARATPTDSGVEIDRVDAPPRLRFDQVPMFIQSLNLVRCLDYRFAPFLTVIVLNLIAVFQSAHFRYLTHHRYLKTYKRFGT